MPENEQAVAVVVAPPCGACRTLRRRCVPGCVFAPYFTAEDFAAVHGVFGASNVSKMLERIELPEQRRAAAATLVEEARARKRDPTFGLISYLRILQEVNDRAREQVDEAREEIAREFGALAASQPVDVAAAAPEARAEAAAQVDAALKHAREQDARLLGIRNSNEVRWRELHQQAGTGTGTGKHAGNGKAPDVVKRHRGTSLSEQTMLIVQAAKRRSSRQPPGFPDERSHQQMAAAEAERGKAQSMRQAAPAENGQMSEASREETMRSVQVPAAAPQQHLDSAPPRHAADDAAGRTPGQGSTSVLLQAMMQLAGAGDEQQQQRHAEDEHGVTLGHGHPDPDGISQDLLQLQEFLDMAALARMQQIMKNDVMRETVQWHAAAEADAMEQDVTTATMQQIPNAAWLHQDAMQYDAMEEASTAEQFAWAQQYLHDPAAVHHHASPWHHQMCEAAHQPAAQVASEQDMLLLLQQHQVAAAESLLSAVAGGARQFDDLAAQYDDTELTLGYGHPDMHRQVVAAGQVAGVQDMNSRQHHHHQHHAENGLDINGHPDGETQALMQKLATILGLAGHQETIRMKQGATTEMGQWDAVAAGVAREQPDVMMTMTQQSPPDGAWLLEMLKRMEKDLDTRLETMSRRGEARHAEKELGITLGFGNGHPDGSSSTQGILQQAPQESAAMGEEKERKLEMLMRQVAAVGRAREREMIAQQQQLQRQLSPGNGHPDGSSSTQGIQQAQEEFAIAERQRKLEMAMRRVAAAGRAREQEMIAQQAAAAAQQQQHTLGNGHPDGSSSTQAQELFEIGERERKLEMLMRQVAAAGRARAQQYSGTTELDISLGQGNPYWHQPTVQQMLQEKQLPNTNLMQQGAAYANGEHGAGAGASLPPLPSSLSQLHAQASHQQRTDGGGQGLNSDLAAYLHYQS